MVIDKSLSHYGKTYHLVLDPLLKTARSHILRLIPENSTVLDATFGRDHYDNFKSYISSGGIMAILEKAGLTSKVLKREIFKSNCQQIVLLGS